jgi:hypothetical protein
MPARSLIARGRNPPEATQGALVILPAVRPCRPFQCPQRGRAADALVAGKGAKTQNIGLKEQAKCWSSAYRMARRREIAWELRSDDVGRAGETVPLQASRVSLPLAPARPPGRSGRQTRRLDDAPHETLRLGVRSFYGPHRPWAKARAWYRIQRAGLWRSPASDTGGRSRR